MLVDVTQAMYDGMPRARTLPDVVIKPLLRLSDGHSVATSQLSIPSHAGTHVDAPSHVIAGGRTIDQLPVDRFVGPAVVASVRRRAGELITIQDVVDGGPPVEAGDIVVLDTGWASQFGSASYYDHPSIDPELADWLVERRVSMLALDAATPDLAIPRRSDGFDFPVHKTLLGSDVLVAENLASLAEVAGRRGTAYALPLVVRGGDAGHTRFVLDVG
ncbi:MAG: cyclase family protein [Nocardioidaceae bacterium]